MKTKHSANKQVCEWSSKAKYTTYK